MRNTGRTLTEQRDNPPRTGPESRTVDVDVEQIAARGRTVTGYAAVYDVLSNDLGGFRERIAPGAFRTVLDAGADVRCLLNHDPNMVLGRTRAGTLRLSDEQRGLRFECDLPETRTDLAESVRRGDLDGASFRFEVASDRWDGDVRTVQDIRTLHDVSIATHPAYPVASIEMRSRDPHPAPAPELAPAGGGLIVRDRQHRRLGAGAGPAGRPGVASEFRAAGFPAPLGEMTTIPWERFDPDPELRSLAEQRALTWSGTTNMLAPLVRQIPPLAFDERWAFTALRRMAVSSDATSVQLLTQTARSLATAANVIRAIDAVTAKPETGSTINLTQTALNQVATIQTAIPNIYLQQAGFDVVIENDLRLAMYGGLDKLVLDGTVASGFQAPSTDLLIVSIRKAITTLLAAGYNPDLVVLTPAASEALDTLVSGISGATADWAGYPPWFGSLRRVVSKSAAAPIVMDSTAFGTLYVSPVSLARFENQFGTTNTSNVRMECNALFGVERQTAAVRIAAS